MTVDTLEPDLLALQVLQRFRTHDYSLTDFVASRREMHPDREAMVHEGRSWTWQQMEGDATRLAARLHAEGVRPSDRVMLAARNSAWHVLGLLACARMGAVLVPINPALRVQECTHLVGHCKPALVLADDEAMPVAADAVAAVKAKGGAQSTLHLLGDHLTEAASALTVAEPSAAVNADTTCIIIYTSGTTGFPKGAMHSQRSLVSAGEAFVERMHLQPTDRLLTILPLFHINAMFYSVVGALAAGAVLLIEPRFSASTFWERVVALRATQVNVIEAVVTMLLNRSPEEYRPGHTLSKVYGVRQAVREPMRQRFDIASLVGGYAMTEIPGVLSTPVSGDVPPGAMGMLCRHPDPTHPQARCKIVDEQGQEVRDGEVGELVVKTPVLMQGYFEDPEQTAQSFRDGWFLTGDLVRRDAQGFYYFVTRKKDIIRRRGENVAGAELDRVVSEHPGVLLAAAVGVPSDFGDEDILVAVKPREPGSVNERDIVEWCKARLAPMKVPRYVLLLEDMPLTPTHKVAKNELKKNPALRQSAIDFG